MRASVVRELEQSLNNPYSAKVSAVLASNAFVDLKAVSQWLATKFREKLAGERNVLPFAETVPPNLREILAAGDRFYHALFRTKKLVPQNAQNEELETPFTEAVGQIYGSMFQNENLYNEGLGLYSALREWIETDLGTQVGQDAQLQGYEQWLQIDKLLETQHVIWLAWVHSVSAASIRKEITHFPTGKSGWKLADAARLYFGFKDNSKAAKNYITNLKKIEKKSAFAFIKDATHHSDELHLKRTTTLHKRLAKRLGLKDFLLFVDSLKYPILQANAFLFISELTDYTELVKLICTNLKLKTSKTHLLLILLEEYFGFISRTCNDLQGIIKHSKSYRQTAQTKALRRRAKLEYKRWTEELVPKSFDAILDLIFPKAALASSRYFLPFFEWINSHARSNLRHHDTTPQKDVIDILNEGFQKRLNKDNHSYTILADRLSPNAINYQALQKLVEVLHENPNDEAFRDKLFSIYQHHLQSQNFSWHSDSFLAFDGAISTAYHFAIVLSCFDDGYQRWKALFFSHRFVHEGWAASPSDYKLYQRESFLLCVGIGMAYFGYSQKKKRGPTQMLFDVANLLLKQQRGGSGHRTIDYSTPLQFAAQTIGQFAHSESDRFIKLLAENLDALKLFLESVYQLLDHTKKPALSLEIKALIEQQIEEQFWIIESSKKDVELKRDFQKYETLKKEVLFKLSRLTVS